MSRKLSIFLLFMMTLAAPAQAFTRYSVRTGDWGSTSTWSASSGGASGASVPVAGDNVVIERGYTVTVNIPNAACATVTINAPNVYSTLQISGSNVLTVSGNFNFVGSGTGTAELKFLATGTVYLGGTFSGTNGVFNKGTGSTVVYNGSDQTISGTLFYNLVLGGSGTKTMPTGGYSNTDGNLTITGTATVTTVKNFTVGGDLTIDDGATFTVGSNYTLTVSGGTTTINGTYINNSTGSQSLGTTTVGATGVYQHNINGGTIPTATWNAGSNCNLTGITSTMPTFPAGTAFSNLTFNSNQTAGLNLGSNSFSVTGTLYYTNTGVYTNSLYFTPFNVNNVVINGGFMIMSGASTARVMNVSGDFTMSSGAIALASGSSASANQTLNVTGDVSISGGTLDLSSSTYSSPGSGLLNVKGNFNIIGGTITESGDATANTITFNGTTDQTFSNAGGTVSGANNFVVNNSGHTVTFSGDNAYTGTTTVSAGTLKLGSAGGGTNTPLGTTGGGTTVSATGAALDLNGYTLGAAEALTLNGTGVSSGGALTNSSATAATYSGLIALGSASSIVTNAGDISITNAGTISGATYGLTLGGSGNGSVSSIIGTTSGTLTKSGSGTWTLSGLNSYTGKTTISAGTLSINTIQNVSGGSSALGAPTTAGNATVDIGATGILKYTGSGHSSNRVINLTASGGSVDASGSGTLTLSGGVTGNTYNLTLTGSGAGSQSAAIATTSGTLTKSGSGTWTLSGANSYTGKTTISAGTLSINTIQNVSGGNSALGAPTTAGNATVDIGATGILKYTGSGHSSNRVINLTASGGTIDASGSGTLTLSGGVTGNTYNLTLTGTGAGSESGAIATTSGTLTKSGSGTWTLSGSSTYTGLTTISAGTIKLGAAGDATNTPLGTTGAGTSVAVGAALDLNGYTLGTAEVLTLNGTGVSSAGALVNSASSGTGATYNGAITLSSASSIGTTSVTTGNITLGGGITGGQDLTKVGAGTLSLGSSTATLGALTISAGTLTSTSGTMNLSGDFTNDGTFTHNSGNVTCNGSNASNINGSSATTFQDLVINKGASSTTVTSTSKAFTVNNNLTVTQGNLTLQATDANYTVTNDLSVGSNGTLTHSVDWDTSGKLLRVDGNLSVDGTFTYTVRSHVQMGGANKTIRTGTSPSGLSILTLVHTSGNITASGTVTVNDNFWASFNTAGGTFATSTYTVTANSVLLNAGGTVNINGGTLNVTGGFNVGSSSTNGNVTFSSGTLTADTLTIGDGTRTGTFAQSGGTANITTLTLSGAGNSYTCTNSPAINISGNFTNNGGTFTPSSSTVTFSGSSSQTLGGTSASTFNNLTLNNTEGLSFGANGTVNGTLTFTSGKIVTGSYKLILPTTASVSGAGSGKYVYGSVQRAFASGAASFTFPIGDASLYDPVALTFTGISTPGNITASVTGSDSPDIASSLIDSSRSVNHCWTLANDAAVFTSYAASFNYGSGSDVDAGAVPANFIVQNYTGGTWTTLTNSGTPTGTSASVSGVSVFGDFAIGDCKPPSLSVVTSASPHPDAEPGEVITYTVLVTNSGTGPAVNVEVTNQISRHVAWSLNAYGAGVPFSLSQGSPASGLTLGTPVYSNDFGSTWTYTPVSGAGGAPAGYDNNVTNWKIPMSGTMNASGANFSVYFKGRIK